MYTHSTRRILTILGARAMPVRNRAREAMVEGVKGVVVVSLAEADERDAERVPTCASGKIVTPPWTRPIMAAALKPLPPS